jgi:hypothetical protein
MQWRLILNFFSSGVKGYSWKQGFTKSGKIIENSSKIKTRPGIFFWCLKKLQINALKNSGNFRKFSSRL